MAENVQLRFRHGNGDLGPFTFPLSATFQSVKEHLLAEWPKDGPMATDGPTQVADIKLIISGKFADNGKTIKEYQQQMGDITSVVTIHCIVRLAATAPKKGSAAPTPGAKAAAANESSGSGCSCIIS